MSLNHNAQQQARDHLWMHFTRHSARHDPSADDRARRRRLRLRRARQALPRRSGRAVRGPGRARPHRARRGGRQAGRRARLLPAVVLRPPRRDRPGRAARRLRPRRPQPGLLHHRRRRGRRERLEAGQAVLQAHRQAHQAQGDQPRHRLPRHPAGRPLDHRPARHEGAVRAAGAHDVPGAEHELLPRSGDLQPGPDDERAFGRWAADRIAEAIEFEGADTVAAVFLEPVQNSGGCFPPPPGYFERVREICDEYDVLLVSDEVICAFGRLGHMFAADRYGYQPDIVTCAKGLTSGYSPLGAMIATDRLFEPFSKGDPTFAHGYTFGGHPVSTAVAMANLDIFEREQLNEHVLEPRAASAPLWRSCSTCRSSATSAATATSTGSSWSRTRPPRRPSTTTSPSGCCAASCPARCSRPASTAVPTTAATR